MENISPNSRCVLHRLKYAFKSFFTCSISPTYTIPVLSRS
uniref:Uncharacterized protein n=1 Tax=Ciona intestinalis TaxID=7719 RepID=F6VD99_CIOIN